MMGFRKACKSHEPFTSPCSHLRLVVFIRFSKPLNLKRKLDAEVQISFPRVAQVKQPPRGSRFRAETTKGDIQKVQMQSRRMRELT